MDWLARQQVFATQFSPVPKSYADTIDFQQTEVTVKETWDAMRGIEGFFSHYRLETFNGRRVVNLSRYQQGAYTFKVTFSDGSIEFSSGANTLLYVEKGQVN